MHVSFTTLTRTGSAVLADFSPTGARLRGSDLPLEGEDLVLTIARLRTYAIVVWSDEEECGLHFDPPLPAEVMADVRATFALTGCWTSELREASEAWRTGLAR